MYLLCYGRSENARKTGQRLIDSIGGRWIDGDDFLSGASVVPEMTGDTAVVMLIPLEAAVRITQEMITESMKRLPVICVSSEGLYAAVIRRGGAAEAAYCLEIYEEIKKILGNKCFTGFGGSADVGGNLAEVASRCGMAVSDKHLLSVVDERLKKGLPVKVFTDLKVSYGDPVLDPMIYDLRKYPSDMKEEFIKILDECGAPYILASDMDMEQLVGYLRIIQYQRSKCTLEELLTGLFVRNLAFYITKRALGKPLAESVAELKEADLRKVAQLIKNLDFEVLGSAPWKEAQVTSGGISGDCVDEQLQLRGARGIFLCGEILDVDGDCGGYNLQWAWSSGIMAGRCCGNSLRGVQ